MLLLAPTSLGEIIDKVTILEIKSEQIKDVEKLRNVRHELQQLNELLSSNLNDEQLEKLTDLKNSLKAINQKLWKIEDHIRDLERAKDFTSEFVEVARSVYFTNDERADIKKQINLAFGSELIEEKSYQDYS